jgi:phosphatidate cytidylyltransferase
LGTTATSPSLPDWRDPPTREIPRVLLEHPLADAGPAYPGPVWREVESDWDHDDLTFAEIVSEGASVAEHGLSLDEPDPFAFDFEIDPGARAVPGALAGSGPSVGAAWEVALDDGGERAGTGGYSSGDSELTESPPTEPASSAQPNVGTAVPQRSRPMHRARASFAGRVRRVERSPASTGDEPASTGWWKPAAKRKAGVLRPATAQPAHAPAVPSPVKPTRNPVVATVTGLAFGGIALLCFFAGPPFVLGLVTIVLFVSMAECYQALRRARYRPAVLLGLLAVPALAVAGYLKGPEAFPIIVAAYVLATMCWYLFGITRRSPMTNIGVSVAAFLRVFPDRHGLAYLLGAIEATIAYDVGGYAFGSWLGDHKLAPRISPNKTWEGLLGGCFVAICISVAVTTRMAPWTVPHALELGVVVSVFAPLGDLVESMIKRDLKVKDMGSLLPAHGGLLDRVDGLLFVLPATYVLVRLFHG